MLAAADGRRASARWRERSQLFGREFDRHRFGIPRRAHVCARSANSASTASTSCTLSNSPSSPSLAPEVSAPTRIGSCGDPAKCLHNALGGQRGVGVLAPFDECGQRRALEPRHGRAWGRRPYGRVRAPARRTGSCRGRVTARRAASRSGYARVRQRPAAATTPPSRRRAIPRPAQSAGAATRRESVPTTARAALAGVDECGPPFGRCRWMPACQFGEKKIGQGQRAGEQILERGLAAPGG